MSKELQPLYSCKRSRDIAEIGPRRQHAKLMKGPLRRFLVIRDDGPPTIHDGVRGGKRGAWGTYSVSLPTCLYPSMVLVTQRDEIIAETLVSLKALRAVHGWRHKPTREELDSLRNGGTIRASIEPTERLEGSFFLLGSAPVSYYHWLIEYVPNIALWRELGGSSKLLIPKLHHRWQRESLAYAGVTADDVVELTAHTHISGDVVFADRVNPTEGKISGSIVPVLGGLRESAGPVTPRRRLFVSRSLAEARRLLNEDDVLARLQPLGFEKVDAETLSFGDQVRSFAGAEIVVGPHGAGLANTVFCPPGGIVVELRAATLRPVGVSAYATLAGIFDHRYGLVLGETAAQQPPERRDSDFTVAPDAVLRMVETLMEQRGTA